MAIDLQLDDSIDFKLYTEHLSYELHSSVTYIRKGRNSYSANPSPFSVVPHVSYQRYFLQYLKSISLRN